MDHEDDNDPNWRVRGVYSNFDPEIAYEHRPDVFTMQVHHGGELTLFPDITYEGGIIEYVDKVNADYFSRVIINDMMMELGYMEEDLDLLKYYFRIPGEDMDFGLRPIGTDADIRRLIKHATKTKVIELYVEKVQKVDLGDLTQEPLNVVFPEQHHQLQNDPDLGDLTQEPGCGGDQNPVGGDEIPVGGVGSPGGGDGSPGGGDSEGSGDNNDGSGNDNEGSGDGSSGKVHGSSGKVQSEGSDSEDPEFIPDDEVSEEDSEGMNEHASNKRANATKSEAYKKVQTEEDVDDPEFIVDKDNLVIDYDDDMDEFRAAVDFDISEDENIQEDHLNEDELVDVQVDIDNFDSLSDPDDETKLQRAVRRIRRSRRKKKPTDGCPFYVGQQFYDRQSIKDLVKWYAVESKRQLYIIRNDKRRFRVVCMGKNPKLSSNEGGCDNEGSSGNSHDTPLNANPEVVGDHNANTNNNGGAQQSCSSKEPEKKPKRPRKKIPPPTSPWVLHISNHFKSRDTWVVKTLINEHDCLHTRDVGLCNISFLTKEVEPIILVNPTIPLAALQDQLQKKFRYRLQLTKFLELSILQWRRFKGIIKLSLGYLGNMLNS
ncbi:putative transposase, MuDR, plant [Helianthus annuus]|nr:putative transposase, MuDR, plant [Helianthus annuus]